MVNSQIFINYVLDYQRGVTLCMNCSEGLPWPRGMAGTLSWVPSATVSTPWARQWPSEAKVG